MNYIFEIIGFILIVLTLLMQWEVYVTNIILLFSLSTVFVSTFLVLLGFSRPEGNYLLFVLAGLTLTIRGIVIPVIMSRALHRLYDKPWRVREDKPMMGVGGSILVSLVLIVLGYYIYQNSLYEVLKIRSGAVPFALFMQASLLIISRRHAYIQMIGFLVMENAVVMLSGWVFSGLPFVVEAGAILDLLGLVVVSSLIIRVREQAIMEEGESYESELRG
jgi:hydrogenase-4 component E